jgi:N-formylglutamate amidohydrolase
MLAKFIRSNPTNPVLLTVPHSGDFYPDIFIKHLKLNLSTVRKIEDFQSDKILNLIDVDCADIIIAKCSRVVVDLNRSRNAIDNDMFVKKITKYQIDEKKMISFGLGVFPKIILNENIYKNKLPVSYANSILDFYYDPFHETLSNQISDLLNRFGVCYHFDLHTMPSNAVRQFKKKIDIVLGNNYGKSSSPELLNHMQKNFENHGLNVELNNPYAGGFITRNYGKPSQGIETIQIEINRSLYMNEEQLLVNNIKPLQEIFKKTFENFSFFPKISR